MSIIPLGLTLSAVAILLIVTALYRVYLHPLASIPGPNLAALSSIYEFYFDCWLEGKFIFEIRRLHNTYGPVVRIGPNEVHISDPDFYDQVQNVTGKFDKDPWYYAFIGSADAGFGSADATLHRARRQAMSRFFSTAAISKLEQTSREKVLKLCEKLSIFSEAGQPVNLSNAHRCLTFENVTAYSLPRGFNMLDHTNLSEPYDTQARSIARLAIWNRHLQFIFPLLLRFSKWYLMIFPRPPQDEMHGFSAIDYFDSFDKQAAQVVHATKRSDKSVLDGIVNSSTLAEDEKTVDRLAQEARTLAGAGTETTGSNLDLITYHILSNTSVRDVLITELKKTVSAHNNDEQILLEYAILQTLPYLSATINETLRLSNSVSGRLPRINRRSPLIYQNHILPPGTVVSVNNSDPLNSPAAFPDPLKFKPERWLTATADQKKLMEKYFVPFGKGARSCIGKELAIMMLYLTTANFVWRFGEGTSLWETTERDVRMEHDLFAPFSGRESVGVRVLLGKREKEGGEKGRG